MKKIFKFIVPCMALACMMTSCYDTMDDKAAVEAAWGSAETPAVTLGAVNAEATSAAISFTVSAQKYQEIGVAVSKSADMSSPVYTPAESVEGTNFTVTAKKLTPLTDYYVAAYAVNVYGQRVMTQAQKMSTPDIKLTIDMVCGHFASDVYADYWGDPSQITDLIVEPDPENPKGVLVKNLDPYFASNGLTADKGYNIFKGEIDLDKNTITVFAEQPIGYQNVILLAVDAPSMADAEEYDDLHISIKDYGETLVLENAWGTNQGGWWSLQNGPIVLAKK